MGAAHSKQLTFQEEGNGPVTIDIRANSNSILTLLPGIPEGVDWSGLFCPTEDEAIFENGCRRMSGVTFNPISNR